MTSITVSESGPKREDSGPLSTIEHEKSDVNDGSLLIKKPNEKSIGNILTYLNDFQKNGVQEKPDRNHFITTLRKLSAPDLDLSCCLRYLPPLLGIQDERASESGFRLQEQGHG